MLKHIKNLFRPEEVSVCGYFTVSIILDRFKIVCTIGCIMIMAIAFSAAAGRTTASTKAVNPPGRPTIRRASAKRANRR